MPYSSSETPATRARAYWNIDGLPEMAWSLFFLAFGLNRLTDALPGPIWLKAVVSILFLGLLFGSLWSVEILEKLKARWTYPRTGYVPPPLTPEELRGLRWSALSIRPEPAQPAGLALWRDRYNRRFGIALGAGFALLMAMDIWSFRWSPCVLGVAAALVFYYAHAHPDLSPFQLPVLASLPLAGVLVSIAEVPVQSRLGWVLIAFGGTGLVSGAATLWRYLHRHPRAGSAV